MNLTRTWLRGTTRAMVAAAMIGILLAGCQKGSAGVPLEERVGEYWELKQSKRWEEAYDRFLDPIARKALSKEAFMRRRLLAFDILSYQIGDIPPVGETAKVEVRNEVNFPLRKPTGEMMLIKKQVTTSDTWVRRDGTWYVQLEE